MRHKEQGQEHHTNMVPSYSNGFWGNGENYLASRNWLVLSLPVTIVVCVIAFFLFLFVGIFAVTHWSEFRDMAANVSRGLYSAIWWVIVLTVIGVAITIGTRFFRMISEGAGAFAAVVHAFGQGRRNRLIAIGDGHVVADESGGHKLRIETIRTLSENRHYNGDMIEGSVQEVEEEIIYDAPPMSETIDIIAQIAQKNVGAEIEDMKWLLGYVDGQPQIGKLYDLRSMAFGGAQGMGKTSTMTFHLYQAAAYGCGMIIIDPHMHNKEGLVPRLKPIEKAFQGPPVSDEDKEIAKRIAWMRDEYHARNKKDGMVGKGVVILVIDEFNSLLRSSSPQTRELLLSAVLDVAQDGRKFGLFIFVAGQIWSGLTTGGASIRQSFPSRIAHKTEMGQLKLLLDCAESEVMGLSRPILRPGQAIISTAQGELYRIGIPLPDNTDGEYMMQLRQRFAVGAVSVREERVPTMPLQPGAYGRIMAQRSGTPTQQKLILPQPPERAADLYDDISENDIRQVLSFDASGMTAAEIMYEMWETPKNGSGRKGQEGKDKLNRIRKAIAARMLPRDEEAMEDLR